MTTRGRSFISRFPDYRHFFFHFISCFILLLLLLSNRTRCDCAATEIVIEMYTCVKCYRIGWSRQWWCHMKRASMHERTKKMARNSSKLVEKQTKSVLAQSHKSTSKIFIRIKMAEKSRKKSIWSEYKFCVKINISRIFCLETVR